MNGLIAIDKPANITSFDVCAKVRKVTNAKVGHTGTLDPMATGVLLVCVGAYTKLVPFLTSSTKTYQATIDLGIKTDTGDTMGTIIEKKAVLPVSNEQLSIIQKQLVTTMMQQVPIYSAVSVAGKRLYQYARKKQDIERPSKVITIEKLVFDQVENNQIHYEATVSKGTYIRVLSETIAEMTDNIGTTSRLVRTANGNITLAMTQSLESIQTKIHWLDPLVALSDYPQIQIDDPTVIYHGKTINLESEADLVCLVYQQKPLAFYKHIGNGVYKSERGLW